MFPGPLDPQQIYELAELGFDLFDSSYAYVITERSQLLELDPDYPSSLKFLLHDVSESG